MGLYESVYANCDVIGAAEVAVIEQYDEASARTTPPGFDDVLGEPFLEDNDGDGIGERVRPGVEVQVKARAEWVRHEEQVQDQVGNAPESRLSLTMFADDLTAKGLLASGVVAIRPNDRLLRIEDAAGNVRVNFEREGREGLYCFEVRPGDTGEGTFVAMFENRRPVAR